MYTTRHMSTSKFGRSAFVALGFLVVLVAAGGAAAIRSSASHEQTAAEAYQAHVGMIARDHPLGGGKEVSGLPDAASLMSTPLFLPTGEGLDPSTADVWVRSGDDEYMLVVYKSGLQVEIRPWPTKEGSPEEHWSTLLSDGLPGAVESVGEFNMFVVGPGETALGSADFVRDGTWVSLYGEGLYSADQLRALAASAASARETTG